ncbi:MAG: TadE/TadG family type IV pilus assembly protein [Bryobacteraceae bacterium]
MKTQIPVTRRVRNFGQRGNALIEFALMSTVLMMLTIGVADFGRIFAMANKATNAASAGTAYGALSPAHYTDTDGMRAAAEADLGTIAGSQVTVTRTCRCSIGGTATTCPASCSGTDQPQTYIRVDVRIPFQTLSRLVQLPSLTQVSGKSEVRVE